MSEWHMKPLGKLAENISRPFGFSGKSHVVFINTGDVLEGKFLHSDYSPVKGLPGQAKKAIRKGDILYSEIRPGNKRYVFIDFDADDYVVSTKFMVIRPITSDISPEFLYLILTSNACEAEFKIIADSRSGTFPQITFDSVAYYPISFPHPEAQKKLVSISGSLSGKIELNRQINRTLEEMAQAIFKSWFVDFDPVKAKMAAIENGEDPERAAMRAIAGAGHGRPNAASAGGAGAANSDDELDALPREQFDQLAATAALFPSSLTDSDLGPIPEGWEPRALEEFFPVITGKKDANYATDDGEYPFFTCSQAQTLFAPYYSFEGDAILLAGNGDFNVKWFRGRFEAYQRTYVLIPFEPNLLPVLYFAMKHFLNDLTLGHKGSVINYLTKGMITGFKLPLPDDELLLKMTSPLGGIVSKYEALASESKTLEEIRDALLPKLLSGEISVDVVEKELRGCGVRS